MQRILKKNYIMDENDLLSEYIKIPFVTIVRMTPFTPKSTSKLRSALHFSYSIVIRRFYSRAIYCAIPNSHYNHGFPNTFDYNHYVYSDYLVCAVTAIALIIRY